MVKVAEMEAKKPLFSSGAYSEINEVEPVNSPPPEKPCTSRNSASRIGASMPMVPYVGRRPMSIVAPPMIRTITASVVLRPILSPRLPQNTPPTGRARNATP